jgi:hypothetical protein
MICSKWATDKKQDQVSFYSSVLKNLLQFSSHDLVFANIEEFDRSIKSWIKAFRSRSTVIEEINSRNSSNTGTSSRDANTTAGVTKKAKPRLTNSNIRFIFEFIHDHFRFMITRNGLGHPIENKPTRLSIHAIFNARLMSEYKDVLIGPSLREKIWPAVQSIRQYNDIVPWLVANRCPFIYDAETVKKANLYGIYRFPNGDVYDGEWDNGKANGRGRCSYSVNHAIYEGYWKDNERYGRGTYVLPSCFAYEGSWKDDKSNGIGICVYDNGDVYNGNWKNNQRHGKGTFTWINGSAYNGTWKDGKPVFNLKF